MDHLHPIIDSDVHFSINPDTRKIMPEAPKKNRMVQHDHNSERYTFGIPRYVEGHDMSLCNIVQVHYINAASSGGEKNCDLYEADDVTLTEIDGEEVVLFSWLISKNATMYNGTLIFAIRFACIIDDIIQYDWHTDIFSGINISSGINNSAAVVEEYSDVLEAWRQKVFTGALIESVDSEKPMSLRDIDSGTYGLYGNFVPFTGSSYVMMFPTNLLASIIREENKSSVQILYPVNNRIWFLEISDNDYTFTETDLTSMGEFVKTMPDQITIMNQAINDEIERSIAADSYQGKRIDAEIADRKIAITNVELQISGVEYRAQATSNEIIARIDNMASEFQQNSGVVENLIPCPLEIDDSPSDVAIDQLTSGDNIGGITFIGTVGVRQPQQALSDFFVLKPGTYTFSNTAIGNNAGDITIGIYVCDTNKSKLGNPYTGTYSGLKTRSGTVYGFITDTLDSDGTPVNSITFTIDKTAYAFLYIYSYSVTDTVLQETILPMLETGTVAHPYTPYILSRQSLRNDINSSISTETKEYIEFIKNIYTLSGVNQSGVYNKTGNEVHNIFGYRCTASGDNAFAEGRMSNANGENSHAEGSYCNAGGENSHAEGHNTNADGYHSHAEGDYTNAEGNRSHAEGQNTTAEGDCAHAEGYNTWASGDYSHAEGNTTMAFGNQHAQGHYNYSSPLEPNPESGVSSASAFIIGNGTFTTQSNAFRITSEGKIYAKSSSISTGADYAEYFEFADGNPKEEDRVGYFITFDDKRLIRIANKDDDYILGISSGNPCVIGNGDECWRGRYILDEFDRYIEESYEDVISVDEDTGEEKIDKGIRWKENPEYDINTPYISREKRPEWIAVGMIGVLPVWDDGTCVENGYCTVSEGGIATSCENMNNDNRHKTYRVLERVTSNIVRVLFR